MFCNMLFLSALYKIKMKTVQPHHVNSLHILHQNIFDAYENSFKGQQAMDRNHTAWWYLLFSKNQICQISLIQGMRYHN